MSSFPFDGLYRVLALLDLSMTYKNDVYLFPVKRSSPLAEMEMLRSHVFVGSTGHFHNEIDFAGSEGLDGVKVDTSSLKYIVSSSPLDTV